MGILFLHRVAQNIVRWKGETWIIRNHHSLNHCGLCVCVCGHRCSIFFRKMALLCMLQCIFIAPNALAKKGKISPPATMSFFPKKQSCEPAGSAEVRFQAECPMQRILTSSSSARLRIRNASSVAPIFVTARRHSEKSSNRSRISGPVGAAAAGGTRLSATASRG